MSKITSRWLDPSILLQLTGMQSDIIGVTGAVSNLTVRMTGAERNIAGLTGAMSGLTVRMTGAERDIAGLTGAVSSLTSGLTAARSDISGLTGAVSGLTVRMTGAERDIAGLTGAVSSLQAYVSGLTGSVNSLSTRMTGAENNIINLQTSVSGLTGAVSNLTARMTGAENNIVNLQTYVSGLTGAVSNLTVRMTGAENSILGLTGAISTLGTPTGAYLVGFNPIVGIGATNIQGAIVSLKAYVDSGITGVGLVTGAQGATGVAGTYGPTGFVGATGLAGSTGLQGLTGPSFTVGTLPTYKASGVTGMSVTGAYNLDYYPITGLSNVVTLPYSSSIVTMLSLKYENVTVGSPNISYLLMTDGVTGPVKSEVLTDQLVHDAFLNDLSGILAPGVHTIQAYWKTEVSNKQVHLINGTMSSIVLEGAMGATGIRGTTGIIGQIGPTGAFGGPAGVTGLRGLTGSQGYTGIQGPGVTSFDKFVKILPLEEWKAHGLTQDQHGELPVLEFDSVGIENMEMIVAKPLEWDGTSNITIKVGVAIDLPLTNGAQASMRLSYKGFNNTSNASSFTPYFTDTITKTLATPAQYDFLEYVFTITAANVSANDYIFLKLEKLVGSPDVTNIGVCYTQLEHGVICGQGPTGIQGTTGPLGGPIGLTGETGLPGPTGWQGLTGIMGFTGTQGYTGPLGLTGLVGITGISGVTGLVGLTGYQGLTGVSSSATGVYNFNFSSDIFLTNTVSQSIALEKSIQINKWRVFAYETGSAQIRLNVGNYPPSFQLDAGATGPYLNLEGVRTSTGFTGWAGTTGAFDDILKVSFVSITGIKSLGLNLYYTR